MKNLMTLQDLKNMIESLEKNHGPSILTLPIGEEDYGDDSNQYFCPLKSLSAVKVELPVSESSDQVVSRAILIKFA